MPTYKDPGKITFTATMQAGDGGGVFVEFPHPVEETFGVKGRVPVKVTFDGIPYTGSMVRMGGERHLLLILKAIRHQLGKDVGDMVKVTVTLDAGTREITPPPDLRRALTAVGAMKAFRAFSYTGQREFVRWIEAAKKPETRENRVERAAELIKAGRKLR